MSSFGTTECREEAKMPRMSVDQARAATGRPEDPPPDRWTAVIALYRQGRLAEAADRARALVERFPRSFALWNLLGAACKGTGRAEEAERAFRKATALNPDHADAHSNLGVALEELGRLDEAIAAYERALAIDPGHADALNNMGIALKARGRLDEAVAAYRRALAAKPGHAAALKNLGVALKELGRLDEAIAACRRALEIDPAHAETHNNLGAALRHQGRFDEAAAAFRRALALKPDYPNALSNLGIALRGCGELDEAAAVFRRALALDPDRAGAHNNLGAALYDLARFGEAAAAFRRALALDPGHADAHDNLGLALRDLALLDEALVAHRRALALRPGRADTHCNLAGVLQEQRRLDEAIAACRRALEIDPDHAAAEVQMLHQMRHVCDWTEADRLAEACARLGIATDAVPPFPMLSMEDHPGRQMARARRWARARHPRPAPPLPARPRPDRLRIGYFSADFHDHAMLHLMSGMLREHDGSRLEVFAYGLGRNREGDMRRRAEADVDRFVDVAALPDGEAIDLVRSHGLDVAIDLMGHTRDNRSRLFARRLAPVQVNFLGYPGTMGADFMDYVVADRTVIPAAERRFYAERVIWLPHSYQPNDEARAIAAPATARSDFGLPEDALVLCCFNKNNKIGPREFDVWMRVLGRVEGSVLWLLRSNRWVEPNLRREAASRGVDPSRLVFAEKLPHAEHLARHRHADLFVDTFAYNAHTTASDALWAGLPVVTKAGRQFAARVAASLLRAAGLPDLVTETEADYEALILSLARDRGRLGAVRARLAANRTTHPLFDTTRYTRNLERGLRAAHDRHLAGAPPADIRVEDAAPLARPRGAAAGAGSGAGG